MSRNADAIMSRRGVDVLKCFKGNTRKNQAADLVRKLKFAQRSTSYLFRGLHNINYELIPSIGRERANGRPFSMRDEKIIFNVLRTEGRMYEERADLSDIDVLALAQHFGGPTRLLDWSTNPLVALYFGVFDAGRIDAEVDGVVYVYKAKTEEFIRKQRSYNFNLNDDEGPLLPNNLFHDVKESDVRFIFPRFVDARIKNQSGLFSVQKTPTVSFDKECDRKCLSYLIIPCEIKETLARYIYGLGITNEFIMPGFAGFCSNLSYRYKFNVGIRSRSLVNSEMEEVEDID